MPRDKDGGFLLMLTLVLLAVAAWFTWVSSWFGIVF